MKGALFKEWLKTAKAEERSKLLRRLVQEGLGTNDVENFIAGQDELRFEVGEGKNRDQGNICNLMEKKLENSLKSEKQSRREALQHLLRRVLSMTGCLDCLHYILLTTFTWRVGRKRFREQE